MKRKLMLLLIYLYTGVGLLTAQTLKVTGVVIFEEDNEPVVGASVYIRKNQVGDNANDNGLYRIKLPQNGTYLVEVSFIGYKTIKQSVTVNRNTTKNFFLEESTEVLNEVVVKASSQQAEINHIRKSPMAVTVVDGAKLRGRSTGIEEVLNHLSSHIGITDLALCAGGILNYVVEVVDGVLQTVLNCTECGTLGGNLLDSFLDSFYC